MKVLEKGNGWSIEQICTGNGNRGCGCNSKLLVEKDDIYVTTRFDFAGDVDYFYTFKCPICGVETDINTKELPYIITKEKLQDYKLRLAYNNYREWR